MKKAVNEYDEALERCVLIQLVSVEMLLKCCEHNQPKCISGRILLLQLGFTSQEFLHVPLNSFSKCSSNVLSAVLCKNL